MICNGKKILCFLITAVLLASGCAQPAETNSGDRTLSASQQSGISDTSAVQQGQQEALAAAIGQMAENGQLTEDEKQELLSFLEENQNSADPIMQAVEAGIISEQQAGELEQLLGASGQDDLTAADEANATEDELLTDVGYTAIENGYPIVDTGQTTFYSDTGTTGVQQPGDQFFGQDACYSGNQPSYTDNGDGTVTDQVTGLMWQQDPGEKMTWSEAVENLKSFDLAGYGDWRLPTIKELYSLIRFTGITGSGASDSVPYINTDYFKFTYGDVTGERFIDSQYASSTIYESTTMGGNTTMFGVNFADGRIKGYPVTKTFYVMYVRGNTHYGINDFIDNGDGTITDLSTGLMWLKYDSGYFKAGDNGNGKLDWQQALEWAENLEFAGYDDWTLPDAKQLQSIVDYTRCPDTTGSPAIAPLFSATQTINLAGVADYGYYWTGTTHLDGRIKGEAAVYIAFGRALGQMNGVLMDVHGAGAQRSDPKKGNVLSFPTVNEKAPQGDVQAVYNFVRVVRKCSISE